MIAIFKREVKAYFTSPIAYVLIGLMFGFTSVIFLDNLYGLWANYVPVLGFLIFVTTLVAPILTMRVLSEDKKTGTEVLLLTSPASISSIVIGKYLASLFVFLVMILLTSIHLIVIFAFGSPDIAPLIGAYIGVIFLGASFLAIGLFTSSLTENQIVAAVVSFIILLIITLAGDIGRMVGGWVSTLANWISMVSRFNDFSKGILDFSHIIYYISVIVIFLFLSIRIIEKRRWS